MVSLIDSAAQFSQRLQDLSVSDGLRRSLKQAGLVTYGGMAYAHGQPGQPIDDAAFEQWIFQNVMQNATVADLSNAKRILFESQTLVFAALKESLTVPEPSSTKRIPPMERETRMAQLRNRLTPVRQCSTSTKFATSRQRRPHRGHTRCSTRSLQASNWTYLRISSLSKSTRTHQI